MKRKRYRSTSSVEDLDNTDGSEILPELSYLGCFKLNSAGSDVCVLAMSPHHRILLSGIGHVTCLLGSVNIYGYKMQKGEKQAVIAPACETPVFLDGSRAPHLLKSENEFDIQLFKTKERRRLCSPLGVITEEFKKQLHLDLDVSEDIFEEKWYDLNVSIVSKCILYIYLT